MKVVYAERARRDMAEIYEAIAANNPAAAQRVEDKLRQTCEALEMFPFASARTDFADVRRVPLVRYPYTIFFRVNEIDNTIEIVRVIHSARLRTLGSLPDN